MQVQAVLDRVEVHSITEEVNLSKEASTYSKWKDEDRFEISDYVRVNGNSTALRIYKLKFPGLKVHSKLFAWKEDPPEHSQLYYSQYF